MFLEINNHGLYIIVEMKAKFKVMNRDKAVIS
jgi:hypothetical protein